ncbi:MAG: Holliday junction resolvase RuvX [Carbonactinosporaceae bacterium]
MRPGVRLGVDVGSVRIGVAVSDPAGSIATPVETVARGKGDLHRIAGLAGEYGVLEVLVGLPKSLSGGEGPAAAKARDYAVRLAEVVAPVPVRLVDERLSTITAERGLRDAGVRGRKGRSVVDQAAAVVILQSALDAERMSGQVPGWTVQAG